MNVTLKLSDEVVREARHEARRTVPATAYAIVRPAVETSVSRSSVMPWRPPEK